jgi:hypothetical protein
LNEYFLGKSGFKYVVRSLLNSCLSVPAQTSPKSFQFLGTYDAAEKLQPFERLGPNF